MAAPIPPTPSLHLRASPWAAATVGVVAAEQACRVAGDLLAVRVTHTLLDGVVPWGQVALLAGLQVAPTLMDPLAGRCAAHWETDVTHRVERRLLHARAGDAARWLEGRGSPPSTQVLAWLVHTSIGLCHEGVNLGLSVGCTAVVLGTTFGAATGWQMAGAALAAAAVGVVASGARRVCLGKDPKDLRQAYERMRRAVWDNVVLGNLTTARAFQEEYDTCTQKTSRAALRAAGFQSAAAAVGQCIVGGVMACSLRAQVGALWRSGQQHVLLERALPTVLHCTGAMHRAAELMRFVPRAFSHWQCIDDALRPLCQAAELNPRERVSDAVGVRFGDRVLDAQGFEASLATHPTGRWTVFGDNGAGKTMLLVAIKAKSPTDAIYLPAQHNLLFDEGVGSTGEQALSNLRAAYRDTRRAPHGMMLVDEWDANLHPDTRATLATQLDTWGQELRVVDISHRSGAAS